MDNVEKKGGKDRPRRRAAERNERTDSITRERKRIAAMEAELEELREWKREREQEEEEETLEDRERLADLLERLAEFMGDHGRVLEYGEGKSWTVVTDDDLLRAAELLDPDD